MKRRFLKNERKCMKQNKRKERDTKERKKKEDFKVWQKQKKRKNGKYASRAARDVTTTRRKVRRDEGRERWKKERRM